MVEVKEVVQRIGGGPMSDAVLPKVDGIVCDGLAQLL